MAESSTTATVVPSVKFAFADGSEIEIDEDVVAKMPFIQKLSAADSPFKPSLVEGQNAFLLPTEIPKVLLMPIVAYLKSSDVYQLVKKLPPNEATLVELLALIDYLCIDPLKIDNLDDISKQMKEDIKDYNERICRKTYEFHSAKYGRYSARQAAAEFVFGVQLGSFDTSHNGGRQKLYNLGLFILSHPKTFKKRLRSHATTVIFDKFFWLTAKQRSILTGWNDKFRLADDSDSDQSDKSISSSEPEYNYDSSDFD